MKRRDPTGHAAAIAGTLAVSGLIAAAGATSPGQARAAASPQAAAKLRVLSVRYGVFRPSGAPHAYTALQIKVRPPAGQSVVSIRYQKLDPPNSAAIADSGCFLPGKRPGRTETFTLAIKLPAGVHRFRVRADSATCGSTGARHSVSRTVTVRAG